MATTVQNLITGARAKFNDGYADHFAADNLNDQVTGATSPRYRTRNRNIVGVSDGAPADPVVLVNGSIVPSSAVPGGWTIDHATGLLTFTGLVGPSAAGVTLSVEYYFLLISDTDYLGFAKDASIFVGVVPTFTAATDPIGFDPLLSDAAEHFMAGHAAEKMANLTSWYYTANAGNKGFDKKSIAANFRKASEDLNADAVARRDDVYKRQGRRNAPAVSVSSYSGVGPYAPPR